ncbi:hypothetical protein RIF29_17841 [Crotalaria pallida]|uniref:F-box domain-containing protein n=1 Tax=Crotalaria pallida TaxID=3830 RepID=A0AAN9IEX3_CROPI
MSCSTLASSYTPLSLPPPQPNDDRFDLLPDEIVHLILNKVHDAQTLIRCLSLSKRFASLIPFIDTVSLSMLPPPLPLPLPLPPPPPHPPFNNMVDQDEYDNNAPPLITFRGRLVIFLRSLFKGIFINLRNTFLPCRNSVSISISDPIPNPDLLSNCPSHRLRIFTNLTRLRFHLHFNSYMVADAALLKWKASYDRRLKSIVILAAIECHRDSSAAVVSHPAEPESGTEGMPDVVLATRMRWTITSVIGAQRRHFALKKMLRNFPTTLKSVVMTDQRRQGRLVMNDGEIRELRESLNREGVPQRTEIMEMVPKMKMKMWYVPEMILPESGFVLKGATLIVGGQPYGVPLSLPVEEDGSDGGYDCTAEEKAVLREAEREIVKKEGEGCYVMDMRTF